MNATHFKTIRNNAGLSANGLAALLGISDGRTVRRWESGERPVTGPVCLIMLAIEAGYLADLQAVKGE